METIELLITDMNQQGQGVGRLAGQVVFVDGAIPGDIVRVSRLIQHGSYAVGELSAIETPSSDRVQPFCPLAGCCGGCSLQPMRYEAQLAHKRRQVCELLTRLGQVGDADLRVVPVLGMENPFRYRCKIQLPVRGTAEQPQIGFFARRSHEVVDGDCCAVSHPAGDVVRRCVREYIKPVQDPAYDEVRHQGSLRHLVVRVARRTGQVLVVLVSREQKLPGTAWLKDCLAEKLAELPVWPDDRLFSGQTVFAGYTLGSLVLNYQPERTNVILGASQTRSVRARFD
jgi:23S rRNA (uracil1939-C5)-methyltransferase